MMRRRRKTAEATIAQTRSGATRIPAPTKQPTARRPARGRSAADHVIDRRLFETSLDLILVVDRQGNFLRVSPSAATILDYRPEEMIGRNAMEFVHPDDLENTRNEMRAARRGQLTRNFETRYVHKDGHPVTLMWTGVWSAEEEQHFFIGRDMTERLAAEERLRRSQRLEAIGQLTGGMAHDFNNLLGVIIGNLDVLLGLRKNDRDVTELAGEALEAAVRGADLTRRLLAFARRQPLRPEGVDVNERVKEIAHLLRRTLGEGVTLTLELVPDVWPITADPAQLEAAITNLATNARDAMPKGGRLIIATGNRQLDAEYAAQHPEVPPGDYALIEVTDTGTGIPPEILGHIFEPFFTTKERDQGTGLGLSMVFGYIKQSGGHINVYSEVGAGTTFRLYLPRSQEAPVAAQDAKAEQIPLGRGETVLVVEDNAGLRRIVVRQLRDLGYDVLEVDNAAAAQSLLEQQSADLLFTDIVMLGEMDGFELARIALNRWPAMRVVLTSGFPQAKINGNLGAAALAARLLSKPYRKEELARTLREVLDG